MGNEQFNSVPNRSEDENTNAALEKKRAALRETLELLEEYLSSASFAISTEFVDLIEEELDITDNPAGVLWQEQVRLEDIRAEKDEMLPDFNEAIAKAEALNATLRKILDDLQENDSKG